MDRQRVRPQPAAIPLEPAWNPALLLMVLIFGLFLGLGLSLRDRVLGTAATREESYLVLSGTLYGQDPSPTTAASLKERLVSLGFPNPSVTVLKLSERLAGSRDRQRHAEAEGLRIFGEALNGVVETAAAPRAAALPTAVSLAAPPAAAPTALAAPTPLPAATPTAALSPTAQASAPAATATPPPASRQEAMPPGATGQVRSEKRERANLRKEPSTAAKIVAVIPYGEKVQVVQVVNGKPDEPGTSPGEARWYQVKWKEYTGYVYFTLLAPAQ